MPERPDAAWAWLDDTGQHGWAVTREDKQGLATRLGPTANIVIPGQWVRIFAHDLPKMRSSDRLSAAGFSVEDDLAAPVAGQHVILGKGEDKRIGVIAENKMEAVWTDVSAANIVPLAIYADFDILRGEKAVEVMDRTIQPGPTGYTTDNRDVKEVHPVALAELVDISSALNFGQGAYASRRTLSLADGPWLRIAAMLVVTALAWLTWQGVQARGVSAQAEALRNEMNTMYTQATGEPAPANLAATVTRAARSGQVGERDFLSLSRALFEGLSTTDEVVIDTLRYDSRRNEISLRLIYSDFETAGQIETTFRERGERFVSGAVREQGGALLGEAVFSSGGES